MSAINTFDDMTSGIDARSQNMVADAKAQFQQHHQMISRALDDVNIPIITKNIDMIGQSGVQIAKNLKLVNADEGSYLGEYLENGATGVIKKAVKEGASKVADAVEEPLKDVADTVYRGVQSGVQSVQDTLASRMPVSNLAEAGTEGTELTDIGGGITQNVDASVRAIGGDVELDDVGTEAGEGLENIGSIANTSFTSFSKVPISGNISYSGIEPPEAPTPATATATVEDLPEGAGGSASAGGDVSGLGASSQPLSASEASQFTSSGASKLTSSATTSGEGGASSGASGATEAGAGAGEGEGLVSGLTETTEASTMFDDVPVVGIIATGILAAITGIVAGVEGDEKGGTPKVPNIQVGLDAGFDTL